MILLIYALAILGCVLIIVGICSRSYLLFRRIKGDPEPVTPTSIHVEFNGVKFDIKTRDANFGLVWGALLILMMGYLPGLQAAIAQERSEAAYKPVDKELKQGEFKLSELEVRVDLRGRKQIGIGGYLGSELSETQRLTRMVFKEINPRLKNINIRHATSGFSIQPLSIPPKAEWRPLKVEEKNKIIHNPFVDFLRGKRAFSQLLARNGRMRTYYLIIPVDPKKDREITYKLKYNNAFQGKEFEWAGVASFVDTDFISLNVTLPENKPLISYEASKEISCKAKAKSTTTHIKENLQSGADQGKPECKAGESKIPKPDVQVSDDHKTLTWNIRNARANEKYFIKWKW